MLSSGRSMSSTSKKAFNHKVLDAPWIISGQFSQLPSLKCIHSLCYSIKSWLDLSEDNIAVIYCSNGRARTGILIACLLKYIKAFETSADAFDFFNSARSSSIPSPILSPSYKIFFDNVDKTMNVDATAIVSAYIPVDLIVNKVIVSDDSSSCTWLSDEGQGIFRINQKINGDFSLLCRFGGSVASLRDKSSLIFKYQNNTAFTPTHTLSLTRNDVDINPDYSEAIDMEIFSIDSQTDSSLDSNIDSNVDSVTDKHVDDNYDIEYSDALEGPLNTSNYQDNDNKCFSPGREAFEKGLDELSKHNDLIPDSSLYTKLAMMGYPSQYIPTVLQLSNNSFDESIKLLDKIKLDVSDSPSVSAYASPQNQSIDRDDNSNEVISNDWLYVNNIEVIDVSVNTNNKPFTHIDNQVDNKLDKQLENHLDSKLDNKSLVNEKIELTDKTKDNNSYTSPLKRATITSIVYTTPSTVTLANAKVDSLNRSLRRNSEYSGSLPLSSFGKSTKKTDKSNESTGQIPVSPTSTSHDQAALLLRLLKDKGINIETLLAMTDQEQQETLLNLSNQKTIEVDSYEIEQQQTSEMKENESITNSPIKSSFNHLTASTKTSPIPKPLINPIGDLKSSFSNAFTTPLSLKTKSYINSNSILMSPTNTPNSTNTFNTINESQITRKQKVQALIESRSKSNNNLSNELATNIADDNSSSNSKLSSKDRLNELLNRKPFNGGILQSNSSIEGSNESKSSHFNASDKRSGLLADIMRRQTSSNGLGSSMGIANMIGLGPGLGQGQGSGLGHGLGAGLGSGQGLGPGLGQGQGSGLGHGLGAGLGSGLGSGQGSGLGPGAGSGLGLGQGVGYGVGQGAGQGEGLGPGNGNGLGFGSGQGAGSGIGLGNGSKDTTKQNNISSKSLFLSDMLNKRAGVSIETTSQSTSSPISSYTNNLKLKDDPKFSSYFKMLKIGLDRNKIANKMLADNVVSSLDEANRLIDLGPDGYINPPNNNTPTNANQERKMATPDDREEKPKDELVALKDHPIYGKYFKMLKVGLPIEKVKAKMKEAGITDDSYIDLSPDHKISINETKPEETSTKVLATDHPIFGKYFKMLKVGLSLETVKAKMASEGVDSSVLDKYKHTDMIETVEEKKKMIALKDHPLYSKYFKMLKIGLPKETVKAKMTSEGVDSSFLDRDPDELIPEEEEKKEEVKKPVLKPLVKPKPSVRKKKLHWKALDASRISSDSLWCDTDSNDIVLDEAEFNKLFVESSSNTANHSAIDKSAKEPKKQKICLIDMKRGQNAGIALARIKYAFEDLKQKVVNMEDEAFTIDQMHSLMEYLPTFDEKKIISNYKGDKDLLGQAEKYMSVMTDLTSAQQRLTCMIYKSSFFQRIFDQTQVLMSLNTTCNSIKNSKKLKKVLKTILKVGNQMNSDANNNTYIGFSLDSLLKLQSSKAYDNKTTILDYVIQLIYKNDPSCLDFPSELDNLTLASRLSIDQIHNERSQLRKGYDDYCKAYEKIKEDDVKLNLSIESDKKNSIEVFVEKAGKLLDELDTLLDDKVKASYSQLLNYFGEDPSMQSNDFFFTLLKFTQNEKTRRKASIATTKQRKQSE
eukprot:gene21343-27652_t